MARLWLEEVTDEGPGVWHLATQRLALARYRMACGWELRLRDARRVWPAKAGDPEPEGAERCRSCMEAE